MSNLMVLLISAIYRGFTIKFEPYEPDDISIGYARIIVTYNGMNYAQIVHESEFKDLYLILSIMIRKLECISNETDD